VLVHKTHNAGWSLADNKRMTMSVKDHHSAITHWHQFVTT